MSKEKDKFGFTENMIVVLPIGLEVNIPDNTKGFIYSFKEYQNPRHIEGIKEDILGNKITIERIKYNSTHDRYFIHSVEYSHAIIAMDIYNLLFDKPIKMKNLQKKSKPKLSNKDLLGL